jgi:hypothetical protein
MLIYPIKVIKHGIKAAEKNEASIKWLKINYPEIMKLLDAIIKGDTMAMQYLLVKKHFVLAAFSNAAWDDKKAIRILVKNKEIVWAAMANIINGDVKALHFLMQNKLHPYV